MSVSLDFIALYVTNLKEAEEYYRSLFGMDVITREAPMEDGVWYALPPDKGWADLDKAGIELGMLALRKDDLVLALFAGEPKPGQIFTIGLSMTADEMDKLHSRLPKKQVATYKEGKMLHFDDKFRLHWQIYLAPHHFQSAGITRGNWMNLP